MKRDFIIITIISIVAVAVSILLIKSQPSPIKETTLRQELAKEEITVSQTIIESLKKKKDLGKISVKSGTTALDLLKSTIEVSAKGDGENAFVTAINGREAKQSAKEFWAFYVNGKQAEVGAGSYVLKNGDVIEWKIETY